MCSPSAFARWRFATAAVAINPRTAALIHNDMPLIEGMVVRIKLVAVTPACSA